MRSSLFFATLLLTHLDPWSALAQTPLSYELAPSGRLRVATQTGSPILATRGPDGSVSGVVVDLGRFIALQLGLPFEPVVYANQEAYAQSFGKGEWDIAIGVRSPAAEQRSSTGPDFMLADALYIAAPGKSFVDASQIDRAGVRVGVSRGGGSDQILTRDLKSAQVVRIPGGVPNAVEALRSGAADVWAANPVTLQAIADALPGTKVLAGAYTTGRYAVALPKESSVAAQNKLAEIVNEAKRTGVVLKAIEVAGFKGVRVAPE
ncbi:MAG: transporter substrate-binding domain-containing protein [Burkholderiaceae bacterium]|nr:transporter substrate-binding domain-containing protein [Burkholderiaceae bacterium]